jgi:hypothetical protein
VSHNLDRVEVHLRYGVGHITHHTNKIGAIEARWYLSSHYDAIDQKSIFTVSSVGGLSDRKP